MCRQVGSGSLGFEVQVSGFQVAAFRELRVGVSPGKENRVTRFFFWFLLRLSGFRVWGYLTLVAIGGVWGVMRLFEGRGCFLKHCSEPKSTMMLGPLVL